MSYRLVWHLTCDFCAREFQGADGSKYIDEDGRFEFARLHEEYGFIERADGSLQCNKHPRAVTS